MATARKPAPDPGEAGPPVEFQAETESVTASEPVAADAAALLEQARNGLLTIINDAVSPDTGHGVDIVLAKQAGEVYKILFGESR
jgi:hypothetical protein